MRVVDLGEEYNRGEECFCGVLSEIHDINMTYHWWCLPRTRDFSCVFIAMTLFFPLHTLSKSLHSVYTQGEGN